MIIVLFAKNVMFSQISYGHHCYVCLLFLLSLSERIIECEEGEVQLQGGPDEFSGIVTICYNGSLTTLCNRFLDYRDATVLCRQAGFDDRG